MIDADLATTPAEVAPDGRFIDVTPEPKAETNSGGMPDAEFNRLNGMMRSADVKESAPLNEYGVSDLRRSEAHTSEPQSLLPPAYGVLCQNKKKITKHT